jgi:hypothetical protein
MREQRRHGLRRRDLAALRRGGLARRRLGRDVDRRRPRRGDRCGRERRRRVAARPDDRSARRSRGDEDRDLASVAHHQRSGGQQGGGRQQRRQAGGRDQRAAPVAARRVRVEPRAQQLQAALQPALHGGEARVRARRDLGRRTVLEVTQHQRRLVRLLEREQRRGDRAQRFAPRRHVDGRLDALAARRRAFARLPVPLRAPVLQAEPQHDGPQPAAERAALAGRRLQGPPRRLLYQVVGGVQVADQIAGETAQGAAVAPQLGFEVGERLHQQAYSMPRRHPRMHE